jgi:hypothetical protein
MTKIGPTLFELWIEALQPRERGLLRLMLSQDWLKQALSESSNIEICAKREGVIRFLVPTADPVVIDPGEVENARLLHRDLKAGCRVILINNTLQVLAETRQFLSACFTKLPLGGFLLITVPHQFLHERKLLMPSILDRRHRRFYTPGTLLAEVEEAIDPCEHRVRFLADSDAGFDYQAPIDAEPVGGQDILLAIEKIASPPWRDAAHRVQDQTTDARIATRFLESGARGASPTRVIAPDPLDEIRRIVVLKLDHRGDFILATEALEILRRSFPEAEITLVCGPWNRAEAERNGFFAKVIPFAFFPEDVSGGLPTPTVDALTESFARLIGDSEYDLAVDLRIFDETRPLLKVIHSRVTAGFDENDYFPWLSIRLHAANSSEENRAEASFISADAFKARIGSHRMFEIRIDEPFTAEKTTSVVWGPYKTLTPGRYQIECLLEPLERDFDALFDVMADFARRRLLAGTLHSAPGKHPVINLHLTEKVEKFEFRLLAGPSIVIEPCRFLGLRLTRQGSFRGVHQGEAMALLAHLVAMRMRAPYTVQFH